MSSSKEVVFVVNLLYFKTYFPYLFDLELAAKNSCVFLF